MAETTTTTYAELIPAEIIAESRLAFQKDVNLLPLVEVADISGVPTATKSFGAHVAATVTKTANETTDNTTTNTMDPTDITLTVARRSVRIDTSDLTVASAAENVNAKAGQIIGKARVKQVEADILGNMTTNWTSSVGATNSTAITPENILSALLFLRTNEADDNLVLGLHSKQEAHLIDDIVVTTSTGSDQSAIGQDAMVSGSINRRTLFGFTVISTPRISTGTDTNDMYLGLAFNGKEMGYLVKNIPPLIEFQRDASKATNEIIMNYYDSSGRIRAAAFVLVKSQTY